MLRLCAVTLAEAGRLKGQGTEVEVEVEAFVFVLGAVTERRWLSQRWW